MEIKDQHWETKTMYLDSVSGDEITKAQDMINAGGNQFTIGSIIIPVIANNSTIGKFYAWVTYKVNPNALKSLNKQTGKVEVTMTEVEGRQLDDDYKQENEVVI